MMTLPRRLTAVAVVAALCLTAAAPQAVAAPPDTPAVARTGLVETYRQGVRTKRLDNGLLVLTKENHAAAVASVFIVFRAGGLLEGRYLGAGISHLTEHLVSGGTTANRTEAEIEDILNDIGAVTNAYTSNDRTAYFINTVPEHVGEAVDLLADYAMHARITQEEFDREHGVVQREILTGESDVGRQVYYLLQEAMYPGIPQQTRIIGYYENIQQLTRQDVLDYYHARYVPSNAVVCAAGAFDGQAVLEMLAETFGPWRGPRAQPPVLPEPAPPVADVVVSRHMDTQLAHVNMAWHSCRLTHPDLYPLDVLAGVLGRGDSSRLVADLKTERNLVYSVSAWNYTPIWPGGSFGVSFTCDADKVDAARQAVLEHIARATQQPPSAEELSRVKQQVVSETMLDLRTAGAQSRDLATSALGLNDPYFSARYAERFGEVTGDEVLSAARRYLKGTNHVTAMILPKGASAAEGAAAASVPEPTTTRTVIEPSGLTLVLHRMPGQPAVSLSATMIAGVSLEQHENAGISSMTARYLERGTTSRDEQELARFFDATGGSFHAGSGWNALYVNALALNEHFSRTLEVFADIVREPAFDPELLESTRQRQLASLKSTLASPWGEGGLFFARQFFRDSPYEHPEVGTQESIAALTRDQVAAFYRKVRTGRNMVLTIAGDFDPARVESRVRELFGDLPAGQRLKAPAGIEPRRIPETEVHVRPSQKPGATVYVGFPGIDIWDTDRRAAMEVYEAICGSFHMNDWLHNVLRGQSLVYAVHFFGRPGLLPGYYRAQALCQSDKVTHVARLMRDICYSGRVYDFSEDDVRRAKAVLVTERRLRSQVPEQIALSMSLNELYGLGYDFEHTYNERLAAVTLEQMQAAVREQIDQAVICITTPQPEAVDAEALKAPFDAETLRKMREAAPDQPTHTHGHMAPQ